MTHPIIILIRPQMGENIGAVARAMSNFGLSELRIVAPRDGWPNEQAVAMASGAAPIIHAATIYDDVPSALHDIQHAYATTARPRELEKRVISPREWAQEATRLGEKTALVFGPERTGLTNEDLSWCRTIITIPTAANASLNIAQSAVVLAYEWWQQVGLAIDCPLSDAAPMAQYEQFFHHLDRALSASDFFKVAEKKTGMMQNLKAMFLRANHSEQELRTLHGVLRALADNRSN